MEKDVYQDIQCRYATCVCVCGLGMKEKETGIRHMPHFKEIIFALVVRQPRTMVAHRVR